MGCQQDSLLTVEHPSLSPMEGTLEGWVNKHHPPQRYVVSMVILRNIIYIRAKYKEDVAIITSKAM